MTIKDEILAIANQLANQGKKPSVALVKTRLSASAPLPLIISTLKNWQHQPEFTAVAAQSIEKSTPATQANISSVDEALAPIKSELAEIKALLKQLIEKKT